MADYKQHNTDETVRFVVQMKPGELEKLQAVENGLYKTFKLMTVIQTGQMHAFDSNSCLRKYETPQDLIREFYGVRHKFYQLRKDYMIGQYGAVANSLSARARFIEEKCAGTLVVENKKRKELIKELVKRGFPTDPIAEWKKKTPQDHESGGTGGNARAEGDSDDEPQDDGGYDFNYLVGMSMWFLTEEKKQQLLKEREQKLAELSKLKMQSIEQIWLDELSELETALDAHEKKELLELENAGKEKVKGKKGVKAEPVAKGARKSGKANSRALEDFKPSADATRIDFQLSEAEKAKYVKAEPKPVGEGGRVKKEKGVAVVKTEKNEDGNATGGDPGIDDLDAMIAGKKKAPAVAKVAGAKVKKEKPDGMKQSKLDFSSSGSAKKKAAPRKKKAAGSDDEDEAGSGGESNSDVEFNINDIVPARERPGGRAASKKITYKFDEDEDEEKSDGEEPELHDNTMVSEGAGGAGHVLSDSEEEEEAMNGKNNTSAEDMFDSLREDEATPAKKKAATPKKKAEPKAAAAKRKPGSDEEVAKKVREKEEV